MGKPYSDDLRERAVLALEAGYTRVEVAELYSLSLSSVGRYIRRKRETGFVSPEKFGGYKRPALEAHTDLVRRLIAERPDSTLAELQAGLAKEKVKVSQTAIFRFVRDRLKLTYKKKAFEPSSRIAQTSLQTAKRCRKHSPNLIRSGSSLSTRLAPIPK
jgi:transposase